MQIPMSHRYAAEKRLDPLCLCGVESWRLFVCNAVLAGLRSAEGNLKSSVRLTRWGKAPVSMCESLRPRNSESNRGKNLAVSTAS